MIGSVNILTFHVDSQIDWSYVTSYQTGSSDNEANILDSPKDSLTGRRRKYCNARLNSWTVYVDS